MNSISDAMNMSLRKKQEVGRPSLAFWRGSLMGGCLRAHWYNSTGEEGKPFDDATLRLFERGHVVSDTVNKLLASSPAFKSFESEVPVAIERYDFAGNIDAVVTWADTGHVEILEYKSVRQRALAYLKEVKPEHAIQAALYSNGLTLQRVAQHRIPARVVYFSADDLETREFPLEDHWYERAWRVLELAHKFRVADRIPPRIPGATEGRKYPCGYCNYQAKCLGGQS
jgi:hypothetical protein